jgi:hypothetical protein
MNVSFYGASVTKQKDGMAEYFKLNNPEFNVFIHGYGGMFLKDAGMCFIDDVLENKPDYCFIDWFSPLPLAPSEEDLIDYLDTLVYRFTKENCILIFILLYRYDVYREDEKYISEKRLKYYDIIRDYAKKYKIQVIDLCKELLDNSDKRNILRDVVHTTPDGSKVYSEYIENEFKNNLNNYCLVKTLPPKNKYSDIKKIKINKKIYDKLKIFGNGEIVGIHQIVGPHSGIINLKDSLDNIQKYKVWDQYCHYEREHVTIETKLNNFLQLEITNDEFDRSKIKKPYTLVLPIPYLNIKNIYYIGSIYNTI